MPSTLQAVRLTEKAARVGFDWEKPEDVMGKIEEEFTELKEAIHNNNINEIDHEIGDLFFALCNLARHKNMNPEDIHKRALGRFRKKFKLMEKFAKEEGKKLSDYSLDEQEDLWQKAKKNEST